VTSWTKKLCTYKQGWILGEVNEAVASGSTLLEMP